MVIDHGKKIEFRYLKNGVCFNLNDDYYIKIYDNRNGYAAVNLTYGTVKEMGPNELVNAINATIVIP